MNKYRIEICERITGSTQTKLRETYSIEAANVASAIGIAKGKCREINSPALTNLSGRIDLSFLVKDENGCIVYNSTPRNMKELDS